MESSAAIPLVASEIHGFHTMLDLDIRSMLEEAKSRWLRPNEIHAMLCNHKYFPIRVKPVTLPKSGEVILFDRKMLRNFRKDGHNWKKKKDGKTVKEAHEHLKVGNEERIHVYYAHGLDNPTFVRRCYWLLDKTLEHVVLVHYRETQELQGSPVTPVNSNSISDSSDLSSPWLLTEETNSLADQSHYIVQKEHLEPGSKGTVTNHQRRLHEINTLEWDELVAMNYPNNSNLPNEGQINSFQQPNEYMLDGSDNAGIPPHGNSFSAEPSVYLNLANTLPGIDSSNGNVLGGSYISFTGEQMNLNAKGEDLVTATTDESFGIALTDGLQPQDSFGRWINAVMVDSPGSVDDSMIGSTISSGQYSLVSPVVELPSSSVSENLFTITDISPAWGFSSEKTKILVTGIFHEQHSHLASSNMYCVCGDVCIVMDIVQVGVFRCVVPPNVPGRVNLYISADGHKPISQVLSFEYRAPLSSGPTVSSEDTCNLEVFRIKMRLARLIFSSSKSLNLLSNKVSPNAVNEAKKYALKTSHIANSWASLVESIQDNSISLPQAQDILFDLALRNRLQEWLLERIIDGRKTTDYDDDGLGVIHLCAILGYTWAVYLYSKSGLSIDFRDRHGWTALHWAAYFGREKMVAALLSAGAKANLVTDPTPEIPGGYTASDIASRKGYDGLAAYLAEKGLIKHFEDMKIAGNASGSLQSYSTDSPNPETFNEEELYLKDTLAAYRTAADAAARIHSAFREHSFKMRSKEIQDSNPEAEARTIVAAMKIQHAYRNFETRKKIAAAACIQTTFRTWKIRKDFLNLRRQTIKIQALFRGYRERRQYSKIVWSVGVLEKAVLRWRLKRKGFRGLQVEHVPEDAGRGKESDTEEDFFRASRKQAEERVERSVVKVQAMFRSKQAQLGYQRMKLAHEQAKLDYEGFGKSDINMDR